jgi:hypothetical protein
MDKVLALGDLPAALPFIKKTGVHLLKTTYTSSQEAVEKLPASIVSFYQQNYPEVLREAG